MRQKFKTEKERKRFHQHTHTGHKKSVPDFLRFSPSSASLMASLFLVGYGYSNLKSASSYMFFEIAPIGAYAKRDGVSPRLDAELKAPFKMAHELFSSTAKVQQ